MHRDSSCLCWAFCPIRSECSGCTGPREEWFILSLLSPAPIPTEDFVVVFFKFLSLRVPLTHQSRETEGRGGCGDPGLPRLREEAQSPFLGSWCETRKERKGEELQKPRQGRRHRLLVSTGHGRERLRAGGWPGRGRQPVGLAETLSLTHPLSSGCCSSHLGWWVW